MIHLDLIIQRRNRLEEKEYNEQLYQLHDLQDSSNPLEDNSDNDLKKFNPLPNRAVLDLTKIDNDYLIMVHVLGALLLVVGGVVNDETDRCCVKRRDFGSKSSQNLVFLQFFCFKPEIILNRD